MTSQPGILAPLPKHARYLMFNLEGNTPDIAQALESLIDIVDGTNIVAGLGPSLVAAYGKTIPELYPFPAMTGPGFDIPSSQCALWLWLRGDDKGELYHLTRDIEDRLSFYFQLNDILDAFVYADSRDLTGYVDGTENPQGSDAEAAAIVSQQNKAMNGSSFVAVQQWRHDFISFDSMSSDEQDNCIGRRILDNKELIDAPSSAHVKRTAQESFSPEAFLLRRSMPWIEGSESGLNFVAFGKDFTAFEAQLKRMIGHDDGICDALFSFSRPLTGAYYWCPPMSDGELNLSALDHL